MIKLIQKHHFKLPVAYALLGVIIVVLTTQLLPVNSWLSSNKYIGMQQVLALTENASFTNPNRSGLITNEYAYYNPYNSLSIESAEWQASSGSMFGKNGSFWTGLPDSCAPNSLSSNCTDSNVFRLKSKRYYSGDIKVSFSLMQNKDIHKASCNDNDSCWHGTHVWLRHRSQYNLYYASINRADGNVVLKRKVPCGNDNGGSYFVLGSYKKHDWKVGVWQSYSVTIQDNASGSVMLKLYDNQVSKTMPVVTGTDVGGRNPYWTASCNIYDRYTSSYYPPIRLSGAVGVRGDFANFYFKDFTVTPL